LTGPPERDPLKLWPLVFHPCLSQDLPGTVWSTYPPGHRRTGERAVAVAGIGP